MDITKLEGQELAFRSPRYKDNTIFMIKVAVADNDIGFTCTSVDDDKENFICYHGPSSPEAASRPRDTAESWQKAKEFLMKAVEEGTWDVAEGDLYIRGESEESGFGGVYCAFG